MKAISVKRADVLNIANLAGRVVPKITTVDEIKKIVVKAEHGIFSVYSTDFEISCKYSATCTDNEIPYIAVEPKPFISFLKNSSEDQIIFELSENGQFKSKTGDFLAIYNSKTYDTLSSYFLEEDYLNTYIEVHSEDLIDAINKTKYSTTIGDDVYNLKGIRIQYEEENSNKFLRLVSTDAQRLNAAAIPIYENNIFGESKGVLISQNALVSISEFCEKHQKVKIGHESNKILVFNDNDAISIRKLDGHFPDYKQLLFEPTSSMSIDKKSLIKSLKRIINISDNSVQTALFSFTRDHKATISVNDANLVHVEDSFEIINTPEPFTVKWNPKHVLEAINTLKSETVTISYNPEHVSFLVTGEHDQYYTGVIVSISTE
jgi:DNA polymerase-3 subunit beta